MAVLIGLVIALPLSVEVSRVDIFYIQLAVFLLLCAFHVASLPKPLPWSSLDRLVLVYVAWVFFSFLVNLAWGTLTGEGGQNFNRVVSLGQFAILLAPYMIGRAYFGSEAAVLPFLKALASSALIVNLYFFYALSRAGFSDLWASRTVLTQRMPVMICLVAIVCGVIALRGGRPRLLFLLVALLGTVLVALSLTRAAYLQWLVSLGAFFALSFRKFTWKQRTAAVLILVALAGVSVGMLAVLNGLEQISMRVSTTNSNVDESASVRVTIWKNLYRRMEGDPLRFIGGFGQLGATYISTPFVSDAGIWIQDYSAHSEYMDIFVRAGIVGLLLILMIFLRIIFIGLYRNPGGGLGAFHFAHAVALCGAIFYGIFQESLRYPIFGLYFWFYAGTVSAMLLRAPSPKPAM